MMRSIIVGALILLAAAIAYFLFAPHTTEVREPPPAAAVAIPAVFIHDSYSKGVHTLRGAVQIPNPCATIAAQASVAGASTSPAIAVAVLLTPDDGICLQQAATSTFTLTASAPKSASITASVDGIAATVVAD